MGVILAAMALGLLLFLFEEWGWNSSAELRAYDMLMRMRPSRTPRSEIEILAIDRKAIDKIGRLPWDQSVHAKIIRALNRAGAKLIVYDTALPEGGPALRAALAERGNVVLPITYDSMRTPKWGTSDLGALVGMERFAVDERIRYSPMTSMYAYYDFLPPSSELEAGALDAGVEVGTPDSSGVVRATVLGYLTTVQYPVPSQGLPPTFALPKLADRMVVMQGLPLAASRAVLGLENQDADLEYGERITLFSDASPIIRIPIDESGEMLINYAGPAGSYPYRSVEDLLSGKLPARSLAGKVVIIGSSDSSSDEASLSTPYSDMPRAEVTANSIATIAGREFLVRSRTECLILLFFLAFLVGLIFPGIVPPKLGIVSLSVGVGYVIVAAVVLSIFGHAWPVISPIVLVILTATVAALLHPSMFEAHSD
jgi:adenylate cyclase